MRAVIRCLPAYAASSAGTQLLDFIGRNVAGKCCTFFSVAVPKAESAGHSVSSSQLILLNHLGTLPSVARNWDSRTVETELRNVDAANSAELELEPTAVQQALAKRYGVSLAGGAGRQSATAALAAVLPPSIRSLAVLYGVLEYGGDIPGSVGAARQLLKETAQARPRAHPLDTDLSPVATSQMNELFNRLGYIGRAPYSYGSAQLMAVCLRTILADVDDEARLRPLPSMDTRQGELIRYLRSRRAPPGTRGMPAVLDVDLSARGGVSRLAAARNILQLLQNHELCASPYGEPVDVLRSLGHTGPVPPTTGEALMLAAELRDRCLRPKPVHLAVLRAAGYGTGAAAAPAPESVAHVKALLRVLRRADTDAATPATRSALRHLTDLRLRIPAAPYASGATAAAAAWGSPGGREVCTVGPCPSQLEVRAAIEDLPLSEYMMDRLYDLGWSGPMPLTHGSALALEEYLQQQKTAAGHTRSSPHSLGAPPPPHADVTAAATAATAARVGGLAGQHRRPGQHGSYDNYQRQQHFVSRLGASPEEALTKIQIRGMFPGAVSEWYLPCMCREEAEHVLSSLMAARRLVLEQASGALYDEYVERWSVAEAEGDWWGMEWLWH